MRLLFNKEKNGKRNASKNTTPIKSYNKSFDIILFQFSLIF